MKRNIRIWFRRMFFVFVVMLWLETGGRQTVNAYGDSGEGLKDQKTVETQPSDTDELNLDETETTEELLKEINLTDVQKMLDDFIHERSTDKAYQRRTGIFKRSGTGICVPFFLLSAGSGKRAFCETDSSDIAVSSLYKFCRSI